MKISLDLFRKIVQQLFQRTSKAPTNDFFGETLQIGAGIFLNNL